MYFLSLQKSFAPLVDIINKIFADIFYFMIVLALFAASFGYSFVIISMNQTDFDGLSEEEIEN